MASWRLRAPFQSEKSQRRCRTLRDVRLALLAALCAFALTPAIARAQDAFNGASPQAQPDDFTGGAPQGETYIGAASKSCIEAQKPNIWKQLNVNPLTCHPQTMGQDANGKCTMKGATLMLQQAGVCYYCEPQNPPGQLYVSTEFIGTVSEAGYSCGFSEIDPGCMWVCSKSGTPTIVPTPTQPSGGGPSTAALSLNRCSQNFDLTTAAGRAAAQAALAKDPTACDVATTVTKTLTDTACPIDSSLPPVAWPVDKTAKLSAALAAAKAMLTKTKALTDKEEWDTKTQAAAVKFFGDASDSTKATVRKNVNTMLAMLNQMSMTNGSFYPAQGEFGQGPGTYAYVHGGRANSHPVIFLTDLFWTLPATGPDSLASAIPHELSHLVPLGFVGDLVYGEGNCQIFAYGITALQNLTGWTIPIDALNNASSFQYFVYYASQ